MRVDVAEKNGGYTITADLPGVRKEDIQVTIDGAQVTLAAEAKREREVSQDERVLELTLPKKAAAARKQISIQ
ncbi:MAG: Hsp20/alpha crystallin family protein [Betaproteobacteria bacterium]